MGFADVLWWMVTAALVVPAHAAAFRRGGAWLASLVCGELVAVALVAVAACSEPTYGRLAEEDGVIEWATTFAFLGAAGFFLATLRRPAPWLERVVRVGLALFCIVVAGEEISWGQRLVGFQPPELFLERNFQQELNLHNILMDENASGLGFELDSKHLVMAIAVAFGLLAPLLVRWKRLAGLAALAPPAALAPLFVAVVAAEATYPVELTGEGAELLLGLLFLCAAASGRGGRAVVFSVAATLCLATVTAPLLARLVYGSDDDGIARSRAEVEVLARDLTTGVLPKLHTKSSIHKRVFTATRDGYYEIDGGEFICDGAAADERDRSRRHYFLDPWNNPYWVYVERSKRRVVVYSFGPNRRRDSDLKQREGLKGDDVAIEVELPARG